MTEVKALRKENQDLKNQVEQLSKEFKNLSAKIASESNQPMCEVEQDRSIQFLSDKYDDFLLSNATIKKELDRLTHRLNEIANNAQRIEKALDDIEAYSYQYNLKVIGVPEIIGGESALDTANLCLKLFTKMGASTSINDIDIAYRVPIRNSNVNKPKPIVCKFTRRLAKDALMQVRNEARKIKPSQLGFNPELDEQCDVIRVFEHLTRKAQSLLFEAKKFQSAHNYSYCWAKSNSVYLRQRDGSHAIKIVELDDLKKLTEGFSNTY
ncbi:uncharacterized protein LOC114542084 [Dendronephthya gigantea]|uniref:uncharacterized protein LOC114542084 n=1 Tax=Dendronephthya gigantea TaxID=151771 RepID=UPI001069E93A|nr:uncharacterized protein LOC114542084 [Dendronephthya gigantea]